MINYRTRILIDKPKICHVVKKFLAFFNNCFDLVIPLFLLTPGLFVTELNVDLLFLRASPTSTKCFFRSGFPNKTACAQCLYSHRLMYWSNFISSDSTIRMNIQKIVLVLIRKQMRKKLGWCWRNILKLVPTDKLVRYLQFLCADACCMSAAISSSFVWLQPFVTHVAIISLSLCPTKGN